MTMDFSRSIVRAARAKPSRPFDGIDILESIEAGRPVQPRTLFWRIRRGTWTRKAVRHGNWKYIALENGTEVQEHLFNLGIDPQEKDNLISGNKEMAVELKRLLRDWEREVRHSR